MAKKTGDDDLQKQKKAIHDLNRVVEDLRMREFESKEFVIGTIQQVIAEFESEIPDATPFVPGKKGSL